MSKKNDSKAVDLHAQLQASVTGAETQVVDAAVAFCGNGADPEPLRAAVSNLLAIRAGIQAMAKHVRPEPKPALATAKA